MNKIAREAIDLLLAAISTEVGDDGMLHQFSANGRANLIGGIYVTNYFSLRRSIDAALFVRQQGARYLRDLSVGTIRSMLSKFIIDHYPIIASEVVFKKIKGNFAEHISEAARVQLAAALEQSALFKPKNETTLFPLVAVDVVQDFSCDTFFLRSSKTLSEEFDPSLRARIVGDQFPPWPDPRCRTETPLAWLGIRSPTVLNAKKMSRVILGAVALTPSLIYRHQFSGRTMWGGYCTVGAQNVMSYENAVTPAMSSNIVLGATDGAWLAILGAKLQSEDKTDRRLLIALEYFYRAWSLDPSERFPILCMGLDATYSEVGHATAAVVDGLVETLGPLDKTRLRMLTDIRASVIHGGAPDVYESSKYGRYYRTYGQDPISDMGLIVAACLRAKLFGGALVEHEEPHAEILAEARAKGRMPESRPISTILEPVSSA